MLTRVPLHPTPLRRTPHCSGPRCPKQQDTRCLPGRPHRKEGAPHHSRCGADLSSLLQVHWLQPSELTCWVGEGRGSRDAGQSTPPGSPPLPPPCRPEPSSLLPPVTSALGVSQGTSFFRAVLGPSYLSRRSSSSPYGPVPSTPAHGVPAPPLPVTPAMPALCCARWTCTVQRPERRRTRSWGDAVCSPLWEGALRRPAAPPFVPQF